MAVSFMEPRSSSAALAGTLRHKILDRKFSPQEPLPSLRQLSDRYGVGIQVVRSALSSLEEEGLVCRRARRGTFVRIDTMSAEEARTALKCINFVERATGTSPDFVRSGYFQGYTEVIENLDLKMRILPCPADADGWGNVFSPNYTYREQGCVLINVLSASVMDWLNKHRVPFVVQSNRAYDLSDFPPHHSVCINKVHGGFEATRHLLALGHRLIGFVGDLSDRNHPVHDVYEGYMAAMSCHGIIPRPRDILDFGTNEAAMAIEPVHDFLETPDGPTAIVAQNDALALATVEAARRLGRRVPTELSVVGFDDLPEAARNHPPLTSVSNPRVQLGRSAVEVLLAASREEFIEPEMRALEGCLVVRESTAAPFE